MTNTIQEARLAPPTVAAYAPATSNRLVLNLLLLLVTIPAAAITLAVLLAMVPFRLVR